MMSSPRGFTLVANGAPSVASRPTSPPALIYRRANMPRKPGSKCAFDVVRHPGNRRVSEPAARTSRDSRLTASRRRESPVRYQIVRVTR